jgi:uncharacterized protein (UPF0212 family)
MNNTEPTLSFFERLQVKVGMLKCPHCGKPLTLVPNMNHRICKFCRKMINRLPQDKPKGAN